jgi:PAS domain S-box-containing protein
MPPGDADPARDPLRAVLDLADEVVVIADATGHVVFANAAIERLVGRAPAEIVGRHFVVALGTTTIRASTSRS